MNRDHNNGTTLVLCKFHTSRTVAVWSKLHLRPSFWRKQNYRSVKDVQQLLNPCCLSTFMKIISGGQTGADQAALDAAMALDIEYGGWLPKGRKTENGPLPAIYRLKELSSHSYRDRTERNVIDSDGTLICSFGPLTGGSALTAAFAVKHDRPCLHIDFEQLSQDRGVAAIEGWLRSHTLQILNVAGPRASSEPRIYQAVNTLLTAVDWTITSSF